MNYNTTEKHLLVTKVADRPGGAGYETDAVLRAMFIGYPALWLSFVGVLFLTIV